MVKACCASAYGHVAPVLRFGFRVPQPVENATILVAYGILSRLISISCGLSKDGGSSMSHRFHFPGHRRQHGLWINAGDMVTRTPGREHNRARVPSVTVDAGPRFLNGARSGILSGDGLISLKFKAPHRWKNASRYSPTACHWPEYCKCPTVPDRPTDLHLLDDTDHYAFGEQNPRVRAIAGDWLTSYFPAQP